MSMNTFPPRDRVPFGSSGVFGYDRNGKGKEREYSDENEDGRREAYNYGQKEDPWILNAQDVQFFLKNEYDIRDEANERKVVLVLGDLSSQDLQPLLNPPRIIPQPHQHVQFGSAPDTLIILVTAKPPVLPPPPPSGTPPRSLIILRLLPPLPQSPPEPEHRISSILTRAEGIATSWRLAPESIFPAAVQPRTRCATQWCEIVPGGEFSVMEEIGYAGTVTNRPETRHLPSGISRFPTSSKRSLSKLRSFKFKRFKSDDARSRPVFDALVNFIQAPSEPSAEPDAPVDDGAILKHVTLVSTLSQAYLTVPLAEGVSGTDAERGRGRERSDQNERGRSTKRRSSLESIKRFFSRSRSRNRANSTSNAGEVDTRKTNGVSGSGNNASDANGSTWSLSSFIRRGRQMSEFGMRPRVNGDSAGGSTSSLPLAQRASHEAIASGYTKRAHEDFSNRTPSAPKLSLVTTREAGTPEYEGNGPGRDEIRKGRRRSVSVGGESGYGGGYSKAAQGLRGEKVKQRVLNSWSRNQLDWARSAGGVMEKVRGGSRDRSVGSRESSADEGIVPRETQRRRAHIIHILPRLVLSHPRPSSSLELTQSPETTIRPNSPAEPILVESSNLPNPCGTEESFEEAQLVPPNSIATAPLTSPASDQITPSASQFDLDRRVSSPSRGHTLSPALEAAFESAAPYSSLGRALTSGRASSQSTILPVLGKPEREHAKRREQVRRSSAHEAASAAAIAAMEVHMSRAVTPMREVSSAEGSLSLSSQNEGGTSLGISSQPPQIPASLLPDPYRHSNWFGLVDEAVAKAGMSVHTPVDHGDSEEKEESYEAVEGQDRNGNGAPRALPTPLALLSGPHMHDNSRSGSLDLGVVIPSSAQTAVTPGTVETSTSSTLTIGSSADQGPGDSLPSAPQSEIVSTRLHKFPTVNVPPPPRSKSSLTTESLNDAYSSPHYPKTELVQNIEKFLLSFSYPLPPPPPPGAVLPLPRGAANPAMVSGAGSIALNSRHGAENRDVNPPKQTARTPRKPVAYILPSGLLGETFDFSVKGVHISVTMLEVIILGMLDPSPESLVKYHDAVASASLFSVNLRKWRNEEEEATVPRVWIGSKQDIEIVGVDPTPIANRIIAAARSRLASEPGFSTTSSNLSMSHIKPSGSLHTSSSVIPLVATKPRYAPKARISVRHSRSQTLSVLRSDSLHSSAGIGPDTRGASTSERDSFSQSSESLKNKVRGGSLDEEEWRTFAQNTIIYSNSISPTAEKDEAEGRYPSDIESVPVLSATDVRPVHASQSPHQGIPRGAALPYNSSLTSRIRSIPIGAAQPISPAAFMFSRMNWRYEQPKSNRRWADNDELSRPTSASKVHTTTGSPSHTRSESSPVFERPSPAHLSVADLDVNDSSSHSEIGSYSSSDTVPVKADSTLHDNKLERSLSTGQPKAPSAQFLAELGLGPGDREKLLRSATTVGLDKKAPAPSSSSSPANDPAFLDLQPTSVPSSPSEDSIATAGATSVEEEQRDSGLWIRDSFNTTPRASIVSSLPPSSESSPVLSPNRVAVSVHTASSSPSPSQLSLDMEQETDKFIASPEPDSAFSDMPSSRKMENASTSIMSSIATNTSETVASETSNVIASHLPPSAVPESPEMSVLSLSLVSLERNNTSPSPRTAIASAGLFSQSFSLPIQRSVDSRATPKRPKPLSSSVSVRGPRPMGARHSTTDSEHGPSSARSIGSASSVRSLQLELGKEALASYAGVATSEK